MMGLCVQGESTRVQSQKAWYIPLSHHPITDIILHLYLYSQGEEISTPNRPRPYTTTSALQVQFGTDDLVVIGINKNSYDVAKVDGVTKKNKVEVTYMKCRPGKKLYVWKVNGNDYTDRIHINTIVYMPFSLLTTLERRRAFTVCDVTHLCRKRGKPLRFVNKNGDRESSSTRVETLSIHVFIDISVGKEYAHYKTSLLDYQNLGYGLELWHQW